MEDTPPVAAQPTSVPAAAPAVTDRRPSPRGVLPRGVQTWLLAGLAAFMLLIMFVVGRPEAPARPAPAAVACHGADCRPRSRLPGPSASARGAEPRAVGRIHRRLPSSTLACTANRRRRRRPTHCDRETAPRVREPLCQQRRAEPATGVSATGRGPSRDVACRPACRAGGGPPTVDEIADAALRATARAAGLNRAEAPAGAPTVVPSRRRRQEPARLQSNPRAPERTGPISAAGPLHRILEGTMVDAVLTNRLDGTTAAPVNCLVTNPLYSHSGQHVLIPAGARLLGETKPVQSFGETRLAVGFPPAADAGRPHVSARPVPRARIRSAMPA